MPARAQGARPLIKGEAAHDHDRVALRGVLKRLSPRLQGGLRRLKASQPRVKLHILRAAHTHEVIVLMAPPKLRLIGQLGPPLLRGDRTIKRLTQDHEARAVAPRCLADPLPVRLI